MRRGRIVEVLGQVVSIPTAPFHEQRVQSHVEAEAARLGLPSRRDRFGNVVVEYRRGRPTTPLAFTAHMDHPGLEVVASGGREALAIWYGAFPLELPKRGVGELIVVHGDDGRRTRGRITGEVKRSDIGAARPFTIETTRPVEPGDHGHFDVTPFREGKGAQAGRVYTKSADDLGGCACILLLLERLVAAQARAHVIALFTRAEEVGFFGMLGAVRDRTLPEGTLTVVLETSRALPEAAIGCGPVVRVGDRARIFDSDLLLFMKRLAEERGRAARDGFRFQMRVMDGGTCEATPLVLAGYPAAGIAIPLGNYHNDAGGRVAPEYVSIDDVVHAVELMVELATRSHQFRAIVAAQKKLIAANLSAKLKRLRQPFVPPLAAPGSS